MPTVSVLGEPRPLEWGDTMRHASSNRSFDTDTQRDCAASRAREHTSCGALPVRAGQLRR